MHFGRLGGPCFLALPCPAGGGGSRSIPEWRALLDRRSGINVRQMHIHGLRTCWRWPPCCQAWGPCSAKCGKGQRHRVRRVPGPQGVAGGCGFTEGWKNWARWPLELLSLLPRQRPASQIGRGCEGPMEELGPCEDRSNCRVGHANDMLASLLPESCGRKKHASFFFFFFFRHLAKYRLWEQTWQPVLRSSTLARPLHQKLVAT